MDLDVGDIDKNYKNTWRTIYAEIDAPYFVEVELFPKLFLGQCKNHPNEPQNNPTETNKNIKIALEEILYVQVVMLCRRIIVHKGGNINTENKILVSMRF